MKRRATGAKFETLLRSMNVSYKIIVSNHYADNDRLREAILHKAASKEMEPLAQEYHKLLEERLAEGRSGLLQSKYFIISCRKKRTLTVQRIILIQLSSRYSSYSTDWEVVWFLWTRRNERKR